MVYSNGMFLPVLPTSLCPAPQVLLLFRNFAFHPPVLLLVLLLALLFGLCIDYVGTRIFADCTLASSGKLLLAWKFGYLHRKTVYRVLCCRDFMTELKAEKAHQIQD